jgi:DNA-binding transcriptional regulator/RsmH inhibitor MraZ
MAFTQYPVLETLAITLDDKHRATIPSNETFYDGLPNTAYIHSDTVEGHPVAVIAMKQIMDFYAGQAQLAADIIYEKTQDMRLRNHRKFFSNMYENEFHTHGRISLPPYLWSHARFSDNSSVFGYCLEDSIVLSSNPLRGPILLSRNLHERLHDQSFYTEWMERMQNQLEESLERKSI